MDDPNSVPEADKDFTRDVFDDTHLNMELAIAKSGNGPKYAKVTRCLRDKNRLPTSDSTQKQRGNEEGTEEGPMVAAKTGRRHHSSRSPLERKRVWELEVQEWGRLRALPGRQDESHHSNTDRAHRCRHPSRRHRH
jgi:hypothetical protein